MTAPPTFSVELSPQAVIDLVNLKAYIVSQGAPMAAQRHAERIERSIEKLEHNPHIGRHVGGGVRELVVVRPQVIRYRITGRRVQVIRTRHGRRRPLPA